MFFPCVTYCLLFIVNVDVRILYVREQYIIKVFIDFIQSYTYTSSC